MPFTYALLAVFFYSIHSALMAPIYREFTDKLSAVFYRGICIGVSFSPALLLVPKADFLSIVQLLPSIVLIATLAVVGTWAAANSVNYLAIGVANTLLTAFSNVWIVLVSIFLLHERLSLLSLLLIFLVLACVLMLGLGRPKGYLPANYNPKKGIVYSIIFAFFTGSAFVLLGLIARQSNPILVSFLWELLIGVCAGIALIAKYVYQKLIQKSEKFPIVAKKTLLKMFIRSTPSGAGTACYALAMTHGSIAIASACLNLCMVITTILTVRLYGEKLSRFQWILLFLICFFLVALRLA